MRFEIEIDREAGNERWIAEVPALPGCLVYGATEAEAQLKAQAFALRVMAERLERGESAAELVDIVFTSRRHPSLGSIGAALGQPGEVSVLAPEQALERLRVSPSALQRLCEEFQVAELSLFGSALRGDFAWTVTSTSWWCSCRIPRPASCTWPGSSDAWESCSGAASISFPSSG